MSTHEECIAFFNSVIKTADERLAITEGDFFDILSSVDTKNATLRFPSLQETFLILHDRGDIKDLLNLYFALLMLESDEYTLCEELLSKIEGMKKPKCNNSRALYNRILFKQLFIILHECGHYFIDTRKVTRTNLYKMVFDLAHEYEEDMKNNPFDDSEWREYILKEYGDNESTEFYRNLWNATNYVYLSKYYYSRESNVNESSADLYALLTIEGFLKEDSPYTGDIGVVYAIVEAACFVSLITALKKQLVINVDNDKESFDKIINNPYSDLYVNLFRFNVLLSYIYRMWDKIPIEIYQVYNIVNARAFKTVQSELDKYEKYIDVWAKGNTNNINDIARGELNKRVIKYSESLKTIYRI